MQEKAAMSIFPFSYKVGASNLPDGQGAREYTRYCMDLLGAGRNLKYIPYGRKRYIMPPSRLPDKG